MDARQKILIGQDGLLIIKPDSVTIKRTFSQAVSTGHLTQREITIKFEHLDRVVHQRAGIRPGYIQFVLRPGSPGYTGMNHSKIHFNVQQSHDFRRAKEKIEAGIEQAAALESPTEDQPGHDNSKESDSPKLNPLTGRVV